MEVRPPDHARELELFADAARTAHATAQRLEGISSWTRLGVFVAGLAGWIALGATQPQGLIWLGASVAAFVVSVRRHLGARERFEDAERLVQMCDESARRMGGTVVCIRDAAMPVDDESRGRRPAAPPLPRIADDGRVWTITAQERDDLDLFAPPVGVYGLLNRTSTRIGACRLRDAIVAPMLEPERIRSRQSAVLALAGDTAARLRLLAACAGMRGEDRRLAELIRAIDGAKPLQTPAPVALLRVWSVLSALGVLVCGIAALGGAMGYAWGLLALLAINGGLTAPMHRTLRDAIAPWSETTWVVRRYAHVSRLAAELLPAAESLGALRRLFAAVARSEVLPRLARRCTWTESAGPIQVLLNGAGLYELNVAAAVLNVSIPHRSELLSGLAAIAELEMLLSLACFAAEQPRTCVPSATERVGLRIRGGCHPLIDPRHVVPNDVTLDAGQRVWIVTGSNMSGKSTLLRMTAINALLAQLGSVAAADEFTWRPVRVVTDLTVSDSLAAGESYFLAEVRHLRRLLVENVDGADTDAAGSPRDPLLGLIDEPFRGTNSIEQTAASVAVVRHLVRSGCLILLATHDRELTTLADGQVVRNFHFREDLGATGMVFDYRLHDGPALTRNALRVLEREGYGESVLRDAYEWLEHIGESSR